jgi:hypothetical protein
MVVIAYYYYAEYVEVSRRSSMKAICYASVRRGGTKDPSLNASRYFHFGQIRNISGVMFDDAMLNNMEY